MQNTFKILTAFLERYSTEVEGREFVELSPEVKNKLHHFARGQLPEGEQTELISALNQHPEWIPVLAELVKGLRAADAKK